MRFRVRTGAPGKDVPAGYGTWDRVYGLFGHRRRDGTRPRVFARLRTRAEVEDTGGPWQRGTDGLAIRYEVTVRVAVIGASLRPEVPRVIQ